MSRRRVEFDDPQQTEAYLTGKELGAKSAPRTSIRPRHSAPRPAQPRPRGTAPARPAAPAREAAPAPAPSQQTYSLPSQTGSNVWPVLLIAGALVAMAAATKHLSYGFFLAVLVLLVVGAIVPLVGILIGGVALFYVLLTHSGEAMKAFSNFLSSKPTLPAPPTPTGGKTPDQQHVPGLGRRGVLGGAIPDSPFGPGSQAGVVS